MCLAQGHIYPSLVLVQHRKTRPYITERLLIGRKESNQIKKTPKNSDPGEAGTRGPSVSSQAFYH